MIKKVLLVVKTVKYLKLKQIVYQVYYRLKPKYNLGHYVAKSSNGVTFKPLNFILDLPVAGLAKPGKNTFIFLNQEKCFEGAIDWNFQGFGKLWNYNLQYFNFLNQPDIPVQTKQACLEDISQWLKNDKLKLEPYPVSLRAINTIRFLGREGVADAGIVNDLAAQLAYLSDSFEYHLLGNHLLENAFALLMGGACFNNKEWLNKGHKVLKSELDEQVLNDGGHFELSPMYHQVILFRLLELIDWYSLYDDKDAEFLNFLRDTASKMTGWLRKMTFNSNEIPLFNDSAPGIAHDSLTLLKYAEQLKIDTLNQVPLSDSGYRMYTKSNYQCAVDVAGAGASYQAGHSHADALSFILYYKDKPVLVEAGTSTYNQGVTRNYERSTAAHNTVVVNNVDSSRVWGGFRLADRAAVSIIKEDENTVIARHDGYKGKFGVLHQRSFIFDNFKTTICDELQGPEVEEAMSYLHLHPSIEFEIVDDRVILNEIGDITFSGATNVDVGEYSFSHGFNDVSRSAVIIVRFKQALQTEIKFLPGN